MKKILLTGLSVTAAEAAIHTWLSAFGAVQNVRLVRDCESTAPVFAVVEMDISDARAFFIASRIRNYWHGGSLVSAYSLMR